MFDGTLEKFVEHQKQNEYLDSDQESHFQHLLLYIAESRKKKAHEYISFLSYLFTKKNRTLQSQEILSFLEEKITEDFLDETIIKQIKLLYDKRPGYAERPLSKEELKASEEFLTDLKDIISEWMDQETSKKKKNPVPQFIYRLNDFIKASNFHIESDGRGKYTLNFTRRARALIMFEIPALSSVETLKHLQEADKGLKEQYEGTGFEAPEIKEAAVILGEKDVVALVEAPRPEDIATTLMTFLQRHFLGLATGKDKDKNGKDKEIPIVPEQQIECPHCGYACKTSPISRERIHVRTSTLLMPFFWDKIPKEGKGVRRKVRKKASK